MLHRVPHRRRDGRLSWLLVPLILLLTAREMLPGSPAPGGRDLGMFLDSPAGQETLSGNWGCTIR